MTGNMVSSKHLPENVVLEKLFKYLGHLNRDSAPDGDFVSIFENTEEGLLETDTGWSLLDDDFEFCMLNKVAVSRFNGGFGGGIIDYSKLSHISPKALYFVEPKLIKSYYTQWKRVQETGSETFVRLEHGGHELFSHMFPFSWGTSMEPVNQFFSNEWWKHLGIRRFGTNCHLKRGERLEKCVMHCVSRHPTAETSDKLLTKTVVGTKNITLPDFAS